MGKAVKGVTKIASGVLKPVAGVLGLKKPKVPTAADLPVEEAAPDSGVSADGEIARDPAALAAAARELQRRYATRGRQGTALTASTGNVGASTLG